MMDQTLDHGFSAAEAYRKACDQNNDNWETDFALWCLSVINGLEGAYSSDRAPTSDIGLCVDLLNQRFRFGRRTDVNIEDSLYYIASRSLFISVVRSCVPHVCRSVEYFYCDEYFVFNLLKLGFRLMLLDGFALMQGDVVSSCLSDVFRNIADAVDDFSEYERVALNIDAMMEGLSLGEYPCCNDVVMIGRIYGLRAWCLQKDPECIMDFGIDTLSVLYSALEIISDEMNPRYHCLVGSIYNYIITDFSFEHLDLLTSCYGVEFIESLNLRNSFIQHFCVNKCEFDRIFFDFCTTGLTSEMLSEYSEELIDGICWHIENMARFNPSMARQNAEELFNSLLTSCVNDYLEIDFVVFNWEPIFNLIAQVAGDEEAANCRNRLKQVQDDEGEAVELSAHVEISFAAESVEPKNAKTTRASSPLIDEPACVVREVFTDMQPRSREEVIRTAAGNLGYKRVSASLRLQLDSALRAAVRRGILRSENEGVVLAARSISDHEPKGLRKQFVAALGRQWVDRDDATQKFARWMGFRRTGPVITSEAKSIIETLLRDGRLQSDGERIRRSQ